MINPCMKEVENVLKLKTIGFIVGMKMLKHH